MKYLCNIWLKFLHWFSSYRVHDKISFSHHWLSLTFKPMTFSMS